MPARRIVDVTAAVQLVEAAEGTGVPAVQDRVHAVLMERRIPLLNRVRWGRSHHEGQRREDEAHQDRTPRGRADRRLASADRLAYADRLSQGDSPQGESVVAAAEEAQAPRAGASQGAHAEDRQRRRGLPLNVERRVGDRQDRDQAKGERGCRTDRNERRTTSRPQPHEARQNQGDHHGQQGREQHPPGQHGLLLVGSGAALAHDLNDDGQDRREDDDAEDERQVIVHEGNVAHERPP